MPKHADVVVVELPASGACWVGHGQIVFAGDSADAVRKSLRSLGWARGFYALGGGGDPAFYPRRSHAASDARRRAQSGGAAVVGRVVGTAGCERLVSLEKAFEPMDALEATRAAIAAEKAMGADLELEAIQKLLNPLKDADYRRLVADLGDHLQRTSGYISRKYMRRMVNSLDFDWSKATDLKLRLLQRRLSDAMRSVAGEAWVSTRGRLYTDTEVVANGTRSVMAKEHNLAITGHLAQKDLGTLKKITASHAHYVTDFYTKQVDPALSKQARLIVRNGVDRGLGNRAIGRELHSGLGATLKGRELPYFNVVANAVVNRSRSYSALVTMKDAGITYYIISAVLDEITTETCRFLDGKILDVEHGLKQFAEVDAASDPTDVKTIMPWVRERKLQTGADKGKRGLFVPQKNGSQRLLAVVDKSGYGKVDDRGTFKRALGQREMAEAGIGTPPYHGSCRTTVIPDTQGVQTKTRRITVKPPVPVVPPTDGKVTKPAKVASNTFEANDHWSRDGYDLEGNPTPQWQRINTYLRRHGTPPVLTRRNTPMPPEMVSNGHFLQGILSNASPDYLGRVRAIRTGTQPLGKHEIRLTTDELVGDRQALAQTIARRLARNRALHLGKTAKQAEEAARKAKWYEGDIFNEKGIQLRVGKPTPPIEPKKPTAAELKRGHDKSEPLSRTIDRRTQAMKDELDAAIRKGEASGLSAGEALRAALEKRVKKAGNGKTAKAAPDFNNPANKRLPAKKHQKHINDAYDELKKVVHPDVMDSAGDFGVKFKAGRASYVDTTKWGKGSKIGGRLNVGTKSRPDSIRHELGHHIGRGAGSEKVDKLCSEYRTIRAVRHAAKQGKSSPVVINASPGFRFEKAYDGGFPSPYVGRVYPWSSAPNEIISMGVQWWTSSAKTLGAMYKADPDMLSFVATIMEGQWL